MAYFNESAYFLLIDNKYLLKDISAYNMTNNNKSIIQRMFVCPHEKHRIQYKPTGESLH